MASSSPFRIRLVYLVSLLFVASTVAAADGRLNDNQLRNLQQRSIRPSWPLFPRSPSPQSSGTEKQCSSSLMYCEDDVSRWCCKKSEFCISLSDQAGGACLNAKEADDACEAKGSVFCYDACCGEGEVCEVGGCRKVNKTSTSKTTKSTSSTSSTRESSTKPASTSSDVLGVPTGTPTGDPVEKPTDSDKDDEDDDGGAGGMSGGAKAGIAVGVLSGVGVGAFALFFFFKRHRRQDTNRDDNMGYDSNYHNMQDKNNGPHISELSAHSFRTASAGSDEQPMHPPALFKQPQFQESKFSSTPQSSGVSQVLNTESTSSLGGGNTFQTYEPVAPLATLNRVSTAPRSHPAFGPSVRSSVVSDMTRPASSVPSTYQTSSRPPSIPNPTMPAPIAMPSYPTSPVSPLPQTPTRTSPRHSLQPTPRQSPRNSYQQIPPANTPTDPSFRRASIKLVPSEQAQSSHLSREIQFGESALSPTQAHPPSLVPGMQHPSTLMPGPPRNSAISPTQLRHSTSLLPSPTTGFPAPPPIPDDDYEDMSNRPNSVATTVVEIVHATPVRRVSLRQAGAVRKIDVHKRSGSADGPLSGSPRSPRASPPTTRGNRGSGGSSNGGWEGTKLEHVPKEEQERW
ncbi:hypothetical protein BJ508DRAFT_302540 [Ascobolus immersus RN42]|uniref:Uncharacterized protein n=1 Tax=Ascobolus immersus RN42 TaxID=1160509 RepID=A0A3N4IND7_ASCIM|nr:hypothetical protein BJ508DRAFT_302540 [Ascobolus immersus RN42]